MRGSGSDGRNEVCISLPSAFPGVRRATMVRLATGIFRLEFYIVRCRSGRREDLG